MFCNCLIQQAGLNAQGKTIQRDSIVDFPEIVLQRIEAKSEKVEAGICKSSEKYLNKLSKIEAKLKRKLYKIDSISANTLFQVDADQQYRAYLSLMAR